MVSIKKSLILFIFLFCFKIYSLEQPTFINHQKTNLSLEKESKIIKILKQQGLQFYINSMNGKLNNIYLIGFATLIAINNPDYLIKLYYKLKFLFILIKNYYHKKQILFETKKARKSLLQIHAKTSLPEDIIKIVGEEYFLNYDEIEKNYNYSLFKLITKIELDKSNLLRFLPYENDRELQLGRKILNYMTIIPFIYFLLERYFNKNASVLPIEI